MAFFATLVTFNRRLQADRAVVVTTSTIPAPGKIFLTTLALGTVFCHSSLSVSCRPTFASCCFGHVRRMLLFVFGQFIIVSSQGCDDLLNCQVTRTKRIFVVQKFRC
ncbi:hypothetical protein V1507DRAFT_470152 [Lipomyces tetrasporus]